MLANTGSARITRREGSIWQGVWRLPICQAKAGQIRPMMINTSSAAAAISISRPSVNSKASPDLRLGGFRKESTKKPSPFVVTSRYAAQKAFVITQNDTARGKTRPVAGQVEVFARWFEQGARWSCANPRLRVEAAAGTNGTQKAARPAR